VVGVAISADWFGETPDVYVARLDGDVERLFTQAAREIARAELDEAARLLAVDRVTSP
jgi:hypothetical protein